MRNVLVLLLLPVSVLWAHHAMEFIELESYSTTRAGEGVFHLHYDYMVDDQEAPELDHWEFTPGLSYGISNRFMLDVHTHFAKFGPGHLVAPQPQFTAQGPSPFMEAVAIAIQYRLTEGAWVDLAVAGVFEQPFERSQELLDGQRVFEAVLIASREIGMHANLTMNLKLGQDGDEQVQEWGLGFKRPLAADPHGFQAGLEILGNTSGDLTVLPGVYFPVGTPTTTLKTGLEFDTSGEQLRANVTLMVLF